MAIVSNLSSLNEVYGLSHIHSHDRTCTKYRDSQTRFDLISRPVIYGELAHEFGNESWFMLTILQLHFQSLDPSANYSKNKITQCHQKRVHANSFIVFGFTFYSDGTIREYSLCCHEHA